MSTLAILAVLALNFGISWWNAYVCGRVWVESKAVGGGIRVLVWCGAIQSAIGFSSVFILPMLFMARHLFPEYFTGVYVRGAYALWYLLIIIPVLGTGFAITVHSWIVAYRNRRLVDLGIAGWNAFAEVHNTWGAINTMGMAYDAVAAMFSSAFSSSSDDPKGAVAMIGLLIAITVVVVALGLGVMLTAILIKRYAATDPLPAEIQKQTQAPPATPPPARQPA
jgi:hypothetical protein